MSFLKVAVPLENSSHRHLLLSRTTTTHTKELWPEREIKDKSPNFHVSTEFPELLEAHSLRSSFQDNPYRYSVLRSQQTSQVYHIYTIFFLTLYSWQPLSLLCICMINSSTMLISFLFTVPRVAELNNLLKNMGRKWLAISKKKDFENNDVGTMLLVS